MSPSPSPFPRLLLSLVLLAGAACAHHTAAHHDHAEHRGPMPHRFDDAEKWAERFDNPERDAWQKPDEVVAALELKPEAKVADIGSATGYFAVRLARAVPRGRVYGVDIEPDMARYLGERARREGLDNLTAVLGEPADPKLPEPVDLVLIVDTYHHIEARVEYLRRLQEKLAPGGRVVIIDFREDSPKGPPRQHKLSPARVEAELKEAGYQLARSHDFLPDQYFLVFQRP